MNDEEAKRLIRGYKEGYVDLYDYTRGITYCAEHYPNMSMDDLHRWAKGSRSEAAFGDNDEGVWM